MCFASSVYKSVYCGSVIIQKSCLLSFCVYIQVFYDKFVLCRVYFSSITLFIVVSHNWVSVPYLVNNKLQIVVDVSTEYHCRSKCMEAAMNRCLIIGSCTL